MPGLLPPLHSQLVVRDANSLEWRSRLQAVDGDELTLARPLELPIEGGPLTGASLELSWGTDGGAYTVPAQLLETRREGLIALWVVRLEGEPRRAQRRAHFRVPLNGPARVELAAGEADGDAEGDSDVVILPAHLVDVSEAAIRLRLDRATLDRFAPGIGVAVSFAVRSDEFEVTGAVLRSWAGRRASGVEATDVVVMLDLDEAQARDLRRVLMAEQVRHGRVARD